MVSMQLGDYFKYDDFFNINNVCDFVARLCEAMCENAPLFSIKVIKYKPSLMCSSFCFDSGAPSPNEGMRAHPTYTEARYERNEREGVSVQRSAILWNQVGGGTVSDRMIGP